MLRVSFVDEIKIKTSKKLSSQFSLISFHQQQQRREIPQTNCEWQQ